MLATSAIVFEMNGHTPGAVNLRGRDLLPAVSVMDGRQFQVMPALEKELEPHGFVGHQFRERGSMITAYG